MEDSRFYIHQKKDISSHLNFVCSCAWICSMLMWFWVPNWNNAFFSENYKTQGASPNSPFFSHLFSLCFFIILLHYFWMSDVNMHRRYWSVSRRHLTDLSIAIKADVQHASCCAGRRSRTVGLGGGKWGSAAAWLQESKSEGRGRMVSKDSLIFISEKI